MDSLEASEQFLYRLPAPLDKYNSRIVAKFIATKFCKTVDPNVIDNIDVLLQAMFEGHINHGINIGMNISHLPNSKAGLKIRIAKKNIRFCTRCNASLVMISHNKRAIKGDTSVTYFCETCQNYVTPKVTEKKELSLERRRALFGRS
jgi:ribosomal protein S27AE